MDQLTMTLTDGVDERNGCTWKEMWEEEREKNSLTEWNRTREGGGGRALRILNKNWCGV